MIHAFRKGRSRNHMVSACIRRSDKILADHDLSIMFPRNPIALTPSREVFSQTSPIASHSLPLYVYQTRSHAGFNTSNNYSNAFDKLMRRPPLRSSGPDRLLLRTTPAGQAWQRDLEVRFPDSVVFKLFQVMIRSLDHDTRSNYGTGLLRFTQFCDHIDIPELSRMPASQELTLISAFFAAHAGTMWDKTLSNWLAGLHFWHLVDGFSWQCTDMLRSVRRGCAGMVLPSSRRAKRPPVTIEALVILTDALDPGQARLALRPPL